MEAIIRNRRGMTLGLALALTAAGALSAQTAMGAPKKVPAAQPKPAIHAAKRPAVQVVRHVPLPRKRPLPAAGASAPVPSKVALRGPVTASPALFNPVAHPLSGRFEPAPVAAVSPDDIAAVKRVIEATRKGKEADADAVQKSISDPAARKLAEGVILRSDNTKPSFERYAAFVSANPNWPHAPLFRRRAENALWNDGVSDAAVLAFFTNHKPRTAKGRYMLARTLLAKGDREGAAALVRYAWRHEECSSDVENKVLEMYGSMLTRADHKVRMEQRFYADDVEAGMRAATRLGGGERAPGSRLHFFARAMAAQRQQTGRSRPADPHRAAGSGRAGRSRPVVAGAAHPGAQAARRQRPADRLPGRARRRPAAARPLPGRRLFHRRLDRAAFPSRSEDRRRPFRSYRREHRQSLCVVARRLLARPRRRGHGPARAGQGLLRDGGAIHRDLLRPDCAGTAGLNRSRPARTAFAPAGRARHDGQIRGRARGRNPLCAQRARLSGVDLCRTRRKRHRCRGPLSAGRSRRQARRRPRHAAARRRRLWARAAARILRLPNRRPAGLPADRAADRPGGGLFDRAPGKPLQPEGCLGRPCHGPDAGDAGGGDRYRQEVQGGL